jgi:hypothetical protein
MAYMPLNERWEAKDFKALARRLSFASPFALEVNYENNEELEAAKKFLAEACKLYLFNYEQERK